jgi:hypothetical protein
MEGVFNCHQLPDMNSASRPAGISQDSCNAAPGSLDIPGIIIYNQEALLSGIMFSEIKVNGFSEPPVLSAAAYGLRAGAGDFPLKSRRRKQADSPCLRRKNRAERPGPEYIPARRTCRPF